MGANLSGGNVAAMFFGGIAGSAIAIEMFFAYQRYSRRNYTNGSVIDGHPFRSNHRRPLLPPQVQDIVNDGDILNAERIIRLEGKDGSIEVDNGSYIDGDGESKYVDDPPTLASVASVQEADEPTEIQQLQCCICHSNKVKIALVPCGHANLCKCCSDRIKFSSQPICPICRSTISIFLRIYQ